MRRPVAVDPIVVDRLCSGLPTLSNTKERRAAIRRMKGWGLSDAQIAARIGRSPGAVFKVRQRMRGVAA